MAIGFMMPKIHQQGRNQLLFCTCCSTGVLFCRLLLSDANFPSIVGSNCFELSCCVDTSGLRMAMVLSIEPTAMCSEIFILSNLGLCLHCCSSMAMLLSSWWPLINAWIYRFSFPDHFYYFWILSGQLLPI